MLMSYGGTAFLMHENGVFGRNRNATRHWKNSWLNVLCAAILAFMLLPRAQASESIVFCLENADVRPWRTKDLGGLNIDLLNEVAKRLNLHFTYRGMPWKRCLAQLKANELNGAIGASFKAERIEMGAYPGGSKPDAAKRMNFDKYVVLRRKGSAVQWDGKNFFGVDGPVGIQLGYSIGDVLRKLGVTMDETSHRARELAFKLTSGQVAAAAMLDGEASSLLTNDTNLASRLEVLPTPLVEKPYFVMFSHAFVAARPELANRIWNAIEEVRNSAAYQAAERDALD